MPDLKQEPPQGVGGWLLLVLLGLAISLVRITHQTITQVLPIFMDGTWAILTDPQSEAYHPLWAPVLAGELAANYVSIGLAAATFWFLVRKTWYAPRVAIAWFAWAVGSQVLDQLVANLIPAAAAQADPADVRELGRAITAAVVWIPYFLVSKRVKATYVRPAPREAMATVAPQPGT